jgi:hypothetical protein
MITKRVLAIALAGAMCLAVPAAYAGVVVKGVDTSSFPVLRVSVLTSDPSSQPPGLRENGQPVRIELTAPDVHESAHDALGERRAVAAEGR